MGLLEKIKSLSEQHSNEVVEFRRHLHANPELSYQEYNTVKFVAEKLRSFGIPFTEGIATTGLIAEIKGKKKCGRQNNSVARRHGCPADHGDK